MKRNHLLQLLLFPLITLLGFFACAESTTQHQAPAMPATVESPTAPPSPLAQDVAQICAAPRHLNPATDESLPQLWSRLVAKLLRELKTAEGRALLLRANDKFLVDLRRAAQQHHVEPCLLAEIVTWVRALPPDFCSTSSAMARQSSEHHHDEQDSLDDPASSQPASTGEPSLADQTFGVRGSLDKPEIGRIIGEHISEIRACYERALAQGPNLRGRVMTRFIITPSGTVSRAEVTSSNMHHPALERCITTRIKTWRFPAPPGGGIVIIEYPFVLRTE